MIWQSDLQGPLTSHLIAARYHNENVNSKEPCNSYHVKDHIHQEFETFNDSKELYTAVCYSVINRYYMCIQYASKHF